MSDRLNGRGYFITGTDTGVGKTVFTAGFLRYLRRHGLDAVSMKPIQTGGESGPNGLEAPDLRDHVKAAGLNPSRLELDLMAPYVYEPACSPHLAGRMAGHYPQSKHIEDCAHGLLELHELLLVEGAGGIYVPLDEDTLMINLMQRLELPVILVARRGLGTINHTMLSLEALRAAELDVAGFVLMETENAEEDFIRKDNAALLERKAGVPLIGNVGYQALPLADFDWDAFEAQCPGLEALAQPLHS